MNYTYSDIQALSIYKELINNGWIDVCTKRQKENNLIALHHKNFTEQTTVKAAIFIKYPYLRLSNDGIYPTKTTSTRPVAKNFLNKTVYTYKNGLPDFSYTPRIENSGIEDDIDFMETALNYLNDNYSTKFKQIVSKKFEITYNKSLEKIKNNKSLFINEWTLRNSKNTCPVLQSIYSKDYNTSLYYEVELQNVSIENRTVVTNIQDIKVKRIIVKCNLENNLQDYLTNLRQLIDTGDLKDWPISNYDISNLYETLKEEEDKHPDIKIDVYAKNSICDYIAIINKYSENIKELANYSIRKNPLLYTRYMKSVVNELKISLDNDIKFIDKMADFGMFDTK